jgi:hypothetical protein
METAPECYAMATQCERQAATVKNPEARQILLEVAAKWRELGDQIRDREASIRRASPRP